MLSRLRGTVTGNFCSYLANRFGCLIKWITLTLHATRRPSDRMELARRYAEQSGLILRPALGEGKKLPVIGTSVMRGLLSEAVISDP